MVIKATDRLADVLARDERVLETILASVPDLRGLRDPVTRRVMGRLATVAQVAQMAGMEPDILLRRLNSALAAEAHGPQKVTAEAGPLKMQAIPSESEQETDVSDTTTALPAFLAPLPAELTSDLDVREDLRNGREPFSRIMAAKAALPPGGVLRLRATFEPVPLYAVMEKQGFGHWTEQFAEDDWRVWFYPTSITENATHIPAAAPPAQTATPDATRPTAPPTDGDAGSSDVVILDVRGLDPPEPMVRTLAALETLAAGQTLLQINERVPQFLLPRLEELGFTYDIREQAEGVVRVFIRRSGND